MLLADIGNRFAHLYDGKSVVNFTLDKLIEKYYNQKLYYINVNPNNIKKLHKVSAWIDISPYIELEGAYKGMGIDRKAFLLSRGDGVYIDAGSAITIDKKLNGKFTGGVIIPGIWHLKKSYEEISSVLKIDSLEKIDLNILPKSSTKLTISYGIIAPIILTIKHINREKLPVYCCGGDGELVANYIDGAIYSKELIFEGMQKVIKESGC